MSAREVSEPNHVTLLNYTGGAPALVNMSFGTSTRNSHTLAHILHQVSTR